MKIFITGSTGYIGGSLSVYLRSAGHRIRGLVRNPDKAGLLTARGIEPILGDLNDRELLTREAQQADAVINAANSDDRNTVETLLTALRSSGKPLIHTSGTSVIADMSDGNKVNDTSFDENSALLITPEKQARRAIDEKILAAQGIRGIVLCNSLIYGEGKLPGTRSVQIPLLINQARESGVMRIVGKGVNIWSNVHIDDLCELYRLALKNASSGAFYFVENGESSFAELGTTLAKRLGVQGPESWSIEQAAQVWGQTRARYSLGSNSRVRSVRAREELGWKPRHNSVIQWILTEMAIE
ncbi:MULTISPECIES: NAD-dependent epimerase/dehydratase family protein [Pectobacteriaceae]|uniref:NAD-dependent epimerase/dehydratase family protein n=1 Tax=Affinibrenneria salicis TaxID=2590031 RepID=A0A5J5FSH2_9GAMM|nr:MULTISPECIES: NAD-dependent epimerase/dehydratase family protein [Pectobacteriaceae]MEE3644446.1 NAD-dependent epimerase/dehydratase family protein [Brenneria sp. L3_3C_1]MEE3652008.1 NAD-dependent epimerase/dehydratase family protein [Brenneria sp. HEZEL_4_2_4]MEE3663646.1 NAD-dependent epimerase/dehydratase family protein [Brenneria sp. g21c3]KAA8995895.1 NAD-dependent epimerase/dehydratase family protein [Affinibrenneria salicis]MBJ7223204.1 NAD-dependent epimerase/dehydratase family pro